MWTQHPITACARVSPCLWAAVGPWWAWTWLTHSYTHATYTHPPTHPGQLLPPAPLQPCKEIGGKEGRRGKKIHREGRKSVGAVERRGGRRWEYVCGCFILLRGCGWRLVGGGMGPGWFSSLMSSIWLTQTQEVTRAACLVNTELYLCHTPERRGIRTTFTTSFHLPAPVTESGRHSPFPSPHPGIFGPRSSGASLILWLKPVQFWGWKQSCLNSSFSDGSLGFIFTLLGLLTKTSVDADLKPVLPPSPRTKAHLDLSEYSDTGSWKSWFSQFFLFKNDANFCSKTFEWKHQTKFDSKLLECLWGKKKKIPINSPKTYLLNSPKGQRSGSRHCSAPLS